MDFTGALQGHRVGFGSLLALLFLYALPKQTRTTPEQDPNNSQIKHTQFVGICPHDAKFAEELKMANHQFPTLQPVAANGIASISG